MSGSRRWALKRRIQYGIGFFVSTMAMISLVYMGFFYEVANCFDGIKNGTESGVDCGGACVRMCTAEVIPPRIVWAKSFEIVPGQYNAVAYIENANVTASTPELGYTFELLSDGEVVATRSGVTVLPPNSVYPIFEGRVFTGGKLVTDTRLTLRPADLWLPANVGREQFRTSNIVLSQADTEPRLSVLFDNTALVPAKDVEIVATLFNELGEPITASQTYIDEIGARSSTDIIFTWPQPLTKTVRSCIIPTDVAIAIDLSGSMNNDGGDPPQPITDALLAAKKFAGSLRPKDQSAVITFATDAVLNQPLSTEHTTTAALIESLTIAAASEVGFTNTYDALIAAASELQSDRHNDDARRVIVLLTDGLPTTAADDFDIVTETKAAAEEIDGSGITIFAIGLGSGVDAAFVNAIASGEDNAFYAPTAEDLDSIYSEITSSLCESGTSQIDVIAKTRANFAPLR